jgi:hypothetical protein
VPHARLNLKQWHSCVTVFLEKTTESAVPRFDSRMLVVWAPANKLCGRRSTERAEFEEYDGPLEERGEKICAA